MPKPICNSMASRKGVAPIDMRRKLPPMVLAVKVGRRNSFRSKIACGVRLA